MKKFKVKIRFVADYLQHKMSVNSQKEISQTVKKAGAENPIKANDPEDFMYKDKKGCYIPSEQIVGCLINSGKDFKIKARRTSYKEFVKAKVFVSPEKIYMGKDSYDRTILSHVKRKDGSRVPIIHPLWDKGLEVEFCVECSDDTGIDIDTLRELIKNGGASYGLGGRHPRWGRFEIVAFKKEPGN